MRRNAGVAATRLAWSRADSGGRFFSVRPQPPRKHAAASDARRPKESEEYRKPAVARVIEYGARSTLR